METPPGWLPGAPVLCARIGSGGSPEAVTPGAAEQAQDAKAEQRQSGELGNEGDYYVLMQYALMQAARQFSVVPIPNPSGVVINMYWQNIPTARITEGPNQLDAHGIHNRDHEGPEDRTTAIP